MSKTDKLWEAIGGIDDSIVEECSGKRPRMTRIPWGTIASAACLCLVIGSLVVMRGLGLLSPATQPTEPTTVPGTSSQPPETTKETAPPVQTVPHDTLPTPELQMYNDLFGDPYGWYNAALRCEYATPEDISLLMLFYGGFEDESRDPTDEEWAQLKDIEGFNENYDLLRLPVRKMDAILTGLFDITLSDVKPDGFEGLTYLESTDCWYHMTTSIRYADFTAQNVRPTLTGTKVYYDGGYKGNMVVTVRAGGEGGYYILSNLPIDSEEQARIDKITALFGEEGSWYNLALTSQYGSAAELGLRYFFMNGFATESKEATDQERELLKYDTVVDLEETLIRLPVEKMDAILMQYFGITVDQLNKNSSAFAGMTYLEETKCWYLSTPATTSVRSFKVQSVTDFSDGTLQVNYIASSRPQVNSLEEMYILRLKPDGDGYQILCNLAAMNADETHRQIFNDLFADPFSWYGKALNSYYETPGKMNLRRFFDNGFKGESQKPTDAEWALLKDVQGFNENYDLFRLPVSKMNEVLTQYFGITVADMDESAFAELTYLESTDCWYYMATGGMGLSGITAQNVEYLSDGTVKVQYTADYTEGVGTVVLQPYGDGYQILSNLNPEAEEKELCAYIGALFRRQGSWYNMALTSTYRTPKEVGLLYFFHNGFEGATEEALPEETAQLKELTEPKGTKLMRLPASKMDEILMEYFGVTLADMDSKAFAGMEYLESTDCWYYYGGGTISVEDIAILSVTQGSDGVIQVNFTVGNSQQAHVMDMEPNGYGYRILMHIALE